MNKFIFTIPALLFLIPFNAFTQCPELVVTKELPVEKPVVREKLDPDKCEAKDHYDGVRTIDVAPSGKVHEQKYKVSIAYIAEITPDNCSEPNIKELKRDTTLIDDIIHPQKVNSTVGGFWMARAELMVNPPETRPKGFMAIQLPATDKMAWYWVVGNAVQYKSKAEAAVGVKSLKKAHPEFCSTFSYYVPEGCQYKFIYK
jgi:hypothetical protein